MDKSAETIGQRLMAEMRHMSIEVEVATDMMTEIERENEKLRELVLDMYQIMTDRCDGPHEQFHGKPCESCAEAGSSDCPKVIAERMRDLGIEVE